MPIFQNCWKVRIDDDRYIQDTPGFPEDFGSQQKTVAQPYQPVYRHGHLLPDAGKYPTLQGLSERTDEAIGHPFLQHLPQLHQRIGAAGVHRLPPQL